VESLAGKGADVNARAWNGATPLHVAVEKGFPEIVRILLEKGADARATDKYGWTPMHQARFFGREKEAGMLRKAGGGKPL